jgi:predicted outer membrane protein
MTLTFPLSVIGLILLAARASAADFSAELDFLTRASERQPLRDRGVAARPLSEGDAKLKSFARQMVDEHGTAEAELQAAAKGSGAAVPTTLDEEHQAHLTALRGASAADFDKAYVADQGENHSNALTLYGDYMLWGEYEKLHALAIKMIPITEAQLKAAQALAGD